MLEEFSSRGTALSALFICVPVTATALHLPEVSQEALTLVGHNLYQEIGAQINTPEISITRAETNKLVHLGSKEQKALKKALFSSCKLIK